MGRNSGSLGGHQGPGRSGAPARLRPSPALAFATIILLALAPAGCAPAQQVALPPSQGTWYRTFQAEVKSPPGAKVSGNLWMTEIVEWERIVWTSRRLRYRHGGEITVEAGGGRIRLAFTTLEVLSSLGAFQNSVNYQPSALSLRVSAPEKEPTEVDWSRTRLIGPDGRAHPVIRSGQKYADRVQASPPSFVPPASMMEDFIFPADLVQWDQVLRRWQLLQFFEQVPAGQAFTLYLPTRVGKEDVLYQIVLKAVE